MGSQFDQPEARPLRIGDVARIVGVTPRTIRYYEEIGLLEADPSRLAGGHRTYTEQEVARLKEIVRLKELLGVPLEELKELLQAQRTAAALREEFQREDLSDQRRRELLIEGIALIDRQLELVERRLGELERLRDELRQRRAKVEARLGELSEAQATAGR
jgi:DNA-binding transcriptional MerR regulator